MTTHEQLVTVLVDHLGVDVEAITPRASIVHDLGADSLDGIQITRALEEAFDIEIGDEEVAELSFGTVEQAVNFLEARLQDRCRAGVRHA